MHFLHNTLKYFLVLGAAMAMTDGVQATDTGNAVLLHNINGYTVKSDTLHRFHSIRFRPGGRIIATYDADLPNAAPTDAPVLRIDGHGATVLPGLIDAHGHVTALGRRRGEVDLVGTRSLQEALQRVRDYAAQHPDAKWILGRGWNHELWQEKRFPTAQALDAVVPDRPVRLNRIDGHASWMNTPALQISGITAATRAPVGGDILRDADGTPSGVLIDLAMGLTEAHEPQPDAAAVTQSIRLAQSELLSLGITSVHDAGVDVLAGEVYKAMNRRGELQVRIYGMLAGAGAVLDHFDSPWLGDEREMLVLRSVKLYADGALGSRGAALLEPYDDRPGSRGLMFQTEAELAALIARADSKGFQVATHAIGDAANRAVLDGYAALNDGAPSSLRHRIEHAQVINPDDLGRIATLGVIASMQPVHATSDMNMAENRVGKERIKGAYAWRRLFETGARIASGSDFPVELANPFHGLYAAVSRQDHAGRPPGGWYPDQVMSRIEALRTFTEDAAFAGHQETSLGGIEAGKWADFIVVDRDFFSIPTADIWQMQVCQTWLAGRQVYRSEVALAGCPGS